MLTTARLLSLVGCFGALAFAAPQEAAIKRLNIVIVEGDGATNNARQRVAREPIVQVEDENHKPIAGVAVLFLLLPGGASAATAGASGAAGATFGGGGSSLTVITDASGRAVAHGLTLTDVGGPYRIQVSASHQGLTANTTITQTNAFSPPASNAASTAAKSGISKPLVIGLAAAAAAGGVYAASKLNDNNSSSSAPTAPPATGGLSNIDVNTASVTIAVWDNGTVDGDIVTLTINGASTPITRLTMVGPPGNSFGITLQKGNNLLVITALNEGSVTPNTGALTVNGGTELDWALTTGQTASMTITVH